MRAMTSFVLLGGAGIALAAAARAADLPTDRRGGAPAPQASCFSNLYGFLGAGVHDCPLTYAGVTLYGQIDIGAGYSSHGANFNGAYPQGVQELIAKFSQGPKFQFVPNGLSRSNVGISAKEGFAPGWSFLFNANTDFDPYSLRLANGPASLVENNATPLGAQTANGDSSRAGQWDNTQGYVGLRNSVLGALTVGRQNSLSAEAVTQVRPDARFLRIFADRKLSDLRLGRRRHRDHPIQHFGQISGQRRQSSRRRGMAVRRLRPGQRFERRLSVRRGRRVFQPLARRDIQLRRRRSVPFRLRRQSASARRRTG